MRAEAEPEHSGTVISWKCRYHMGSRLWGGLGVARPLIDGIPGHALVITTCLCIYMKDRLKVKCLMTTQVVIRTFPDSALDGCPAVGHRTSV